MTRLNLQRPFHKSVLFVLVLCFIALPTYAQKRCGTVEYTVSHFKKNLRKENDQQFEEWLNKKIATRSRQTLDAGRTQATTYQIPVVVHVVHNGEAIGAGVNISDAQIQSQIDVLNKDFQRLNADAVNTPAEFLSVAGSMSIEFMLAKQDPAGLATTGIVRVLSTQMTWSIDDPDDKNLKALSYWPAEDYLNIWICNVASPYLGYTQFPVSNLPGMENSKTERLTDGLVISYQYFGTDDAGNFNLASRYDKGRTVTHEMGHFFGLRHIWGDDSGLCITDTNGKDDFVSDTPDQGNSTTICPSSPRTSCSVHSMYQNYMDYTDDACMNMFTKNQVVRMTTVLENSIRRKTLPLSHGLLDPTLFSDNLGIIKILSPLRDECTHAISPSIEVKNVGKNAITSTEIQLKLNDIPVEVITFPLTLAVGQSTNLNFTSLIRNAGNTSFTFTILKTNGVTDGEPSNDVLAVNTMVSDRISTPFEENFIALPSTWKIQNIDQRDTWKLQPAPFYVTQNTAAAINFFEYTNEGSMDALVSPPFDLTNESLAFVSFDVAYARNTNRSDGLKVVVLTDCSTEATLGTEIYFKEGDELSTATPTSIAFKPKNESEWRKEVLDLSAYIGFNNLRIAFVGINGRGNNLYIDNVSMITSLDIDAAITGISNPSIVSCTASSPKVLIQNTGTTNLTSFNVKYRINAGEVQTIPITGLALKSGEKYDVTLPELTLKNGTNTIGFEVSNPNNGGDDIDASNNKRSTTVVTNNAALTIPFRETFNSGFGSQWLSLNPTNGNRWTLDETNYKTSAIFKGFTDTVIGNEAWLVSPSLDFSYAEGASVVFDRSYALNEDILKGEQLRILAATGCGNQFEITLYDSSNINLANVMPTDNWRPSVATDWRREVVDLYELAGQKDVRIAFVVTNGNGNNLYLDNIEFYTSSWPDTRPMKGTFAIYYDPLDSYDFNIRFNLPEQQTIALEIVDMMGRSIMSTSLDYTLNQNYPVLLEGVTDGVYIIRLHTKDGYYAQRVFIQK